VLHVSAPEPPYEHTEQPACSEMVRTKTVSLPTMCTLLGTIDGNRPCMFTIQTDVLKTSYDMDEFRVESSTTTQQQLLSPVCVLICLVL
jgi:hypothetical protein